LVDLFFLLLQNFCYCWSQEIHFYTWRICWPNSDKMMAETPETLTLSRGTSISNLKFDLRNINKGLIWNIIILKLSHVFSDIKRACELLEKLQRSKYCKTTDHYNKMIITTVRFNRVWNIIVGGEVPATKLAALQKVLQSEFLNAVREVYEHVYETVDVQGNPEIR